VAAPEFEAHNTVSLIVGPGQRKQAERLVEALHADPARVFYDEERKAYAAFSLERVFLSLLQQSAALIIDKRGIVRLAVVAANPMDWLNPRRIKQLTAALDELDSNP